MKKFLIYILILLLLSIGAFVVSSYIFERFPKIGYICTGKKWIRISKRVRRSEGEIKGDTLYIGDSVGSQLYPFNDNNYLTSNGSVYAVGNYILAYNAIKNNSNIKCIIYLSIPNAVGHRLTRKETYNNFVKPFYNSENLEHFNKSTSLMNILNKNQYLDWNKYSLYKFLPIDDYNYNNEVAQFQDTLSPISMEWIMKIDSLCQKNNVVFHLVSPPVPKSMLIKSNNWDKMRKQVKNTKLEKLFTVYFKTINYQDDKNLKDDAHWKESFIKENRKKLVDYIWFNINNVAVI